MRNRFFLLVLVLWSTSCQTSEVEKKKDQENKISNPNDAIIRLDEKLNNLDSYEDSIRQFLENKKS